MELGIMPMPILSLIICLCLGVSSEESSQESKCEKEQYYDLISLSCQKCTVCGSGFSGTNCTEYENAKCSPCPQGYFKSKEGNTACQACRQCKVSHPCTPFNDTVCGKATEGASKKAIAISVGVIGLVVIAVIVLIAIIRKRRRGRYGHAAAEPKAEKSHSCGEDIELEET